MLVAQAKEASEWFTGKAIDDTAIHAIHTQLRSCMENIVLIGMPGCGKTTVGKALAERLGRTFVDADEALVNDAGRTIPDIFATDGEATFRQMETNILAQLGMQSGLIIATGGGCVTRQENYPLLHQNGTIFWLTRDLEKLPTEGRPLSLRSKLEDMYLIRKPLYERFADHIIGNNDTTETALEQILRIREEKT
jgi:shikimate dehydrogenase